MRWIVILGCCFTGAVTAQDRLVLTSPVAKQVIQREGYSPAKATIHQPGGPKMGFADVPVQFQFPLTDHETIEARTVLLNHAFGQAVPWTPLIIKRDGANIISTLRVPAGGWYRLEVQVRVQDKVSARGHVEPVGVGEVFLIAGQSYAGPYNDEPLKIDDPQERVTQFNWAKKEWQTAHDAATGGTIWPPMANLLLPVVQVPIGFVNVSVGATSSTQWQPGKKLFQDAAVVGRTVGRFRYVLWQQGESDVIDQTTTEQYITNLKNIREGLAKEWGFAPPWLLAKSTLHPTVYQTPDGENRIRTGLERLATMPGFRPGPDTDVLAGENRGGPTTKRHFSGIGQRRAGSMWFASIWTELAAMRD